MIKTFLRYLRIWWEVSRRSFQMVLSQKLILWFFLIGKILRFGIFFLFLFFILKSSNGLAGYSTNQTILFFLTFNLIDVISQFLFREVYRFRPMVVTGDLDLILVKPINTLFRVLMGGADIIDLVTIPPLVIAVWYVGSLLSPSSVQIIYFILLLVNGLIIATAFHIFVLSMAIITLEIDHTVMVYRDLTSMGRLPIDIYKEPVKSVLTYLIPVGIMMSFPVKAIIGLVSFPGVISALIFGVMLLLISIKFWHFALKKYASASS